MNVITAVHEVTYDHFTLSVCYLLKVISCEKNENCIYYYVSGKIK